MTELAESNLDLNPSKQSIRGLNGLLFCISDVRHGVGPLLSIFLRGSLHWDAGRIGLALGIIDLSAVITQIPSSLFVDATRHKRALVVGSCSLIILGSLSILFFSSFFAILAAQLFMGIAIATLTPALGGITLGLVGRKKLPKRLSSNEVWNHSGNVATALTAGFFGFLLGNEWIFYWVIVFGFASIFFCFPDSTKRN